MPPPTIPVTAALAICFKIAISLSCIGKIPIFWNWCATFINPLRTKVVSDYQTLGRHPYCGRSVILGGRKDDRQDTHYILRLLGTDETTAKHRYSDFVKEVLLQADEHLQQKHRMQAERYDLERLIQRVAEIMDMSPEQIMNSGKGRKSLHTRSVLCYWATDQLGITTRADIESKPAICRGKELVEVQLYSLLDTRIL